MKNKKIFTFFCILLCLTLLFSASNFAAFSLDKNSEGIAFEEKLGQFVSSASRSQLAGLELEAKTYSRATLEQDFDGSSVLVVIDKNVSRINRVYDKSFFGSLAIEEIEDLSIVVNDTILEKGDFQPVPSANSWAADYMESKSAASSVDVQTVADSANANAIVDSAKIKTTGNKDISTVDESSEICECYSCTVEPNKEDELPENWELDREDFRQVLKIELPVDSKENVLKVIAELEKIPGVVSAEPNYIGQTAKTPNDVDYNNIWALKSSGAGRIDAPLAWDITTGSYDVKVGVMDTGIDTHLDLITSVCRLQDYDFIGNSSLTTSDPNGHGTHVAGIIGAIGNNSIGVTGVAWRVKLITLRVGDQYGFSITSDNVIKAINHATNKGIHILNASFVVEHTAALQQTIKEYPGLLVAAAGNYNSDNDKESVYPANYNLSNVISVGASNAANVRATGWGPEKDQGSNYGKSTVHLFAPGDNILSTVPINDDGDLDLGSLGVLKLGLSHWTGFARTSGTSMAAPHVTGVAALMLCKNPNLTPSQIRTYIMNNVDKSSAYSNTCISGGRLNAYKALAAVPEPSSGC